MSPSTEPTQIRYSTTHAPKAQIRMISPTQHRKETQIEIRTIKNKAEHDLNEPVIYSSNSAKQNMNEITVQ
ncbi:hypothetical protein ES702_07133 [subsurface metagenome]